MKEILVLEIIFYFCGLYVFFLIKFFNGNVEICIIRSLLYIIYIYYKVFVCILDIRVVIVRYGFIVLFFFSRMDNY